MYNNVSLTAAQCREIFERTTLANVTISADTVVNQQAALDALIGNTYENDNCAIRIIQATDATNYRLFIDNITFNADDNLEDISVQFVGTGVLTIENTNGTEVKYTSSPVEVEQTSGTLVGGGSIVVIDNTKRVTTDQTVSNSTAIKLVFDGAGTSYTVSGGSISEFENVTGIPVSVSITDNAPLPTLTETNGSITVIQNINITAPNLLDSTRVQIYNVTKALELDNSVVSGGSGYSLTVNLQGANVDDGDTIRLRAAYQSGAVAKIEIEAVGIVSSTGLTFLDTQLDNESYNTYGVDGSTISEFTYDSGNLEVDINDTDNTTQIQRVGAWYSYYITTADGVANLLGCMNWESINSIKIDQALCDLKLDNIKANPLLLTGGRMYRADGSTIIAATSNSIQIDYDPVYAANVNDIWNVDVVNGSFTGGSAASIIKNTPRIIARKSDL
jgi:hypothetical protein